MDGEANKGRVFALEKIIHGLQAEADSQLRERCVPPPRARAFGYETGYGQCVGPYGRQGRRGVAGTRTRTHTRVRCKLTLPPCCENGV